MKPEENPLLRKAEEIVPIKPWERVRAYQMLIGGVIGIATLREVFDNYHIEQSWPYHVAAAAIYAVSAVADNISTSKFFQVLPRAKKVGVKPEHGEFNAIIGKIADKEEANFVKNPISLAIDVGATIFVGFGGLDYSLPISGIKFLAYAKNSRLAKRYEAAAQIGETASDEFISNEK